MSLRRVACRHYLELWIGLLKQWPVLSISVIYTNRDIIFVVALDLTVTVALDLAIAVALDLTIVVALDFTVIIAEDQGDLWIVTLCDYINVCALVN